MRPALRSTFVNVVSHVLEKSIYSSVLSASFSICPLDQNVIISLIKKTMFLFKFDSLSFEFLKKIRKSATLMVDLFISPCNFVIFYFMYFKILLPNVCRFS